MDIFNARQTVRGVTIEEKNYTTYEQAKEYALYTLKTYMVAMHGGSVSEWNDMIFNVRVTIDVNDGVSSICVWDMFPTDCRAIGWGYK